MLRCCFGVNLSLSFEHPLRRTVRVSAFLWTLHIAGVDLILIPSPREKETSGSFQNV